MRAPKAESERRWYLLSQLNNQAVSYDAPPSQQPLNKINYVYKQGTTVDNLIQINMQILQLWCKVSS
jgi:hypothetical protein